MASLSKVGKTATVVFSDESGALCCVYHRTCVAKKLPDGRVKLNSGGWKTATTRTRMNQFANAHCGGRYSVFQKAFDWFIRVNGETVPFVDGVEV